MTKTKRKTLPDKRIIDWLRTLIYACTVLTVSAAALGLSPQIVAGIGVISLVATYRLDLFTDKAVNTALRTPVAHDASTPPAGTYGAGHE